MTDGSIKDPRVFWENGYSVGELWGKSAPVSRGGPHLVDRHLIMWGILSIVDDQVREGAGHKYLQDRLWQGDWIAIGVLDGTMVVVPPIKDAKFGRKPSTVGDGVLNYVDARILHGSVFEAINHTIGTNHPTSA